MNTELAEAYTASPPELTDPERESAYNAYLASLDTTEIVAYCKANALVGETQESLELYLHDCFTAGMIREDDLSAEILVLLGEL